MNFPCSLPSRSPRRSEVRKSPLLPASVISPCGPCAQGSPPSLSSWAPRTPAPATPTGAPYPWHRSPYKRSLRNLGCDLPVFLSQVICPEQWRARVLG